MPVPYEVLRVEVEVEVAFESPVPAAQGRARRFVRSCDFASDICDYVSECILQAHRDKFEIRQCDRTGATLI